jgi:GTP-binding protein Era
MEKNNSHSGYVAIVGRPNVGKSTLLNRILGEKLSITSRKPQTTRHRILGIKTIDNQQTIYVDTPGMHIAEHTALNRHMNRAARNALHDVDIILFVVDGLKWTEEDEAVAQLLKGITKPTILVINKTDTLPEKEHLLSRLQALSEKQAFLEIVPLSAKKGSNVEKLQQIILKLLPEGPQYFPEDAITDRGIRFRVGEIIREKVIRALGDELPYSSTVGIETYKEENNVQHISATIWVEREGQKPIVIGKGGERLKEIGTRARKSLENLLEKKIHLRLWVKVRGGWSDDERALASLGYIDLP